MVNGLNVIIRNGKTGTAIRMRDSLKKRRKSRLQFIEGSNSEKLPRVKKSSARKCLGSQSTSIKRVFRNRFSSPMSSLTKMFKSLISKEPIKWSSRMHKVQAQSKSKTRMMRLIN